jgi:MoaA/NifB/PqqE/SkfB family radical SAM enzyme
MNQLADPTRYFDAVSTERGEEARAMPVCLYLEVTNRCNLLCETCPRTFDELEKPADMSMELFTSIVDQVPDLARAVLHGIGEPMLVKHLPQMVAYLKQRDVHVLFNTNGTLLTRKNGEALISAGLDELRVSLDAADAATFKAVRGRDYFARIVRNVKGFVALKQELGATKPVVSLWLTGLRETIAQLPDFVRIGHEIGVASVHLQRLVFAASPYGLAREASSLFERTQQEEEEAIAAATTLAASLGIIFDASGAAEPEASLKRESGDRPWSLCRRPWSLMYFTAHGRAIPCCIAPFSQPGYENYTLGNATQASLREIWNGDAYRAFRRDLLSETPPVTCQNCGLRWSL